jgi:hypothetical protein
MLAEVITNDRKITEIIVCNKEGLTSLKAKVFIDATGDADLSAWSGVECTKGREEDGKCQPMTMKMKMINVSIDRIKEFVLEHPEQFPRINMHIDIINKSPRLSIGGFTALFRDAVANHEITFKRSNDILFFETSNKDEVIINTTRIIDLDATDGMELTLAEIEGRRQVKEVEQFLIKHVPGFENARLIISGPRIGVRSSRQIKGVYTLTKEDLLACKLFEDRIAFSAYPIDVHPPEGIVKVKSKDEFIPHGAKYSIPYRTLVNGEVENIITVGRCISATFEAQGGIRTTPTAGAIGHAGGAAASLAVKYDIATKDVPIKELQELLMSQGAYLNL